MYVNVKNDNYGYGVATYGDYVAVSNPPTLRWNAATASVYCTGSVDYFKYNSNTNNHDYVGSITRTSDDIPVDLISEDNNTSPTGPNFNISTESGSLTTSSSLWYASSSLSIDKNLYTSSVEDGYGLAIDMYNTLLVIGSPYFTQIVATSASIITASGATVEVHDLSITSSNFTPISYVQTLYNPYLNVTQSFGSAVSINSSWIAVGSPLASQSLGVVHMYQNISTGSSYSWSFYQTIEPSGSLSNAQFGSDLKLNKTTSSLSQSLIVGCGNLFNNAAYYFEFISGSWIQTYIFNPTTDIYPLTIGDFPPYQPTIYSPYGSSGFGAAVSTYEDAVVIGAWSDRSVYEFSGSLSYQQGSTYIFERCQNTPNTTFVMVLKTYGTPLTLKNNYMGYSVDMTLGTAIVGIPKIDNQGITSCYIQGTLDQLYQCASDLEDTLLGQAMLLQKNTSSGEWGITNVYQKKKQYLSPYKSYGNDVSIDGRSMVVGAPILLSDSNRYINLNVTSSSGVGVDDIAGKAYIYNMANLWDQFHIGNVFYRNGKIVVMTSGSLFDGLFSNEVNQNLYEYDVQFSGQHTIFEKQVICSINPGEFNVSTNPTAITLMTSSFDLDNDGVFGFPDVDVILRYMQYKNTSNLGLPFSTDWSSSVITTNDEASLYNFYISQSGYNPFEISMITSESISSWESTQTWVQSVLDLNQDNKIDILDMNIMWKYFASRLTQKNYATYITPSCQRQLFSDITDYMEFLTQENAIPQINTDFLNYETQAILDKTGSFLAPLATTIGLYSGLDLVAVAKLGTPIKITPDLPINFAIKLDY